MWPIGIVGQLKPGWEDAGAIAIRLEQFLESVAQIDPMFRTWRRGGTSRHFSAVPAFVTMSPRVAELRCWLEENGVIGSREGRKATRGFSIRARTSQQNPLGADFWLSFVPADWWFGHQTGIAIFSDPDSQSRLDYFGDSEAEIGVLRRMLLVMATAWDCEWAGLTPGNYRRPGSIGPIPVQYRSGWMVYLSAASAAQIALPRDIAFERLTDGAILLKAAVDEIFSDSNPHHMEAAFRIQEALAPLNNLK